MVGHSNRDNVPVARLFGRSTQNRNSSSRPPMPLLFMPGSSSRRRDARELDRSHSLSEYGTAAGSEQRRPQAVQRGGVIAACLYSVEQEKGPQSPVPSPAPQPGLRDDAARILFAELFAELDTHNS